MTFKTQTKSAIIMRAAIEEDAIAVSDLIIQSINFFHSENYAIQALEIWRRGYNVNKVKSQILNRKCIVLEIDGKASGFIQFDAPKIKGFYIHPKFSGQGFGGLLLQKMLSQLKLNGQEQIELTSNKLVLPFYEKFGFEFIQEEIIYWENHPFLEYKMTINLRNYESIADKIIQLKNEDLALRDKLIEERILEKGYNKAMEKLHNRNASKLNEIINNFGYPTIIEVGKEASEAAWLVIQHSIGQPEFMRKCAQLLEISVNEKQANPKNLAYLTDRIAVFEGKPQLYGTQFDWDENGVLNPNRFDDLNKVNQRRKSIGLNTLEAQTELIRQQARQDNQVLPTDFEQRKKEFEQWRKKVGWIE